MNNQCRFFLLFLLFFAASLPAAVRIEIDGGYSYTSPYQYLDTDNTIFTKWIEFKKTNFVNANLRLSTDIINDDISLGVLAGFLRRFDLYRAERADTSSPLTRTNIGSVFSFPLMGYVEDRIGPFMMNVGCGVSLTRFNINDPGDTVGFVNQGVFGFLFGGGYSIKITKSISIPVRAELMVNVPTVWFDLFPNAVRETYHASRDNDMYVYSGDAVVWNANVTVGLQYAILEQFNLFRWNGVSRK